MQSSFGNINWKDLSVSIGTAVVSAIVNGLYQIVNTPGFSLNQINWQQVLTFAVVGLVGSLGAAFGTTQNGKFAGII